MNEQEARAVVGLGAVLQKEGGIWYHYADGKREEVKAKPLTKRTRTRKTKKAEPVEEGNVTNSL